MFNSGDTESFISQPPTVQRSFTWERQDGHDMVRNRRFNDFGMILGPVYISFLSSRSLKYHFCSGLFPGRFLSIYESQFRQRGTPTSRFSQGKNYNNRFVTEIVFNEFRNRFLLFFNAMGAGFLVCCALKASLKND